MTTLPFGVTTLVTQTQGIFAPMPVDLARHAPSPAYVCVKEQETRDSVSKPTAGLGVSPLPIRPPFYLNKRVTEDQ